MTPVLPCIPDDLTIPQFMFDYQHECRPIRNSNIPWLIEDQSGRAVSELELRERTSHLANSLKSRFGIGEDDLVLIFSPNHIDYPLAIWAIHRLGGIVSGANPDFSSDELLYQLEQTKPSLVIVHSDRIEVALSAIRHTNLSSDRIIILDTSVHVADARLTVESLIKHGRSLGSEQAFVERKLSPGEAKTKLAFLSFSSGTTGRPKAVAIAHYAVIANVIQIAIHNNVNKDYCSVKDQRFRPGDVALGVLPLYHIYGLIITLHYIVFCAMSLVVIPKYNFVEMLKSIVRHRITHIYLVPPQAILLCKHPAAKDYDLRRSVRFIMSAAAPLSHELTQQLFDLFPDAHIGQGYGSTETCTAITMFSIMQKRGIPGSAGQLLPGIDIKIVKSDGSLAADEETGELYVRTPSAALRYANDEEATKETFTQGWIRTGDEVKMDRDGNLWVLDRLKEIMKVKGFQVAPAELEGCLLDHEDVSSACVVGVPDDYSGEVPLAFVVLTADATHRVKNDPSAAEYIKASIIRHVAQNKVSYKHLAGGVEFLTAIPTSPSGKLLRRILRDEAKALKRAARPKL